MKRAIAQTATHIHVYRANITLALLVGCLVAALFYAVNLYGLISKTVLIGQLEKQTTVLSSQISYLDAEYLALSSAITPDKMAKYGLEKGQVSYYITRLAPTAYAPDAQGSVRHEF